jgi:phosphohistidine swiveling domain-containing protein
LLTAWSLWSHGVPVPDFGVPSDFARAHATSPLLTGPLIVRPRRADGNQTTMLVEDPRDVDWNSVDDDLLVQEFVPGTSYKAIVYRPLQGKGRLTSVLEEVVLEDGEVVAAASTDARAVPEIERVAQAAVRAVGLTGPAEVSVRSRGGGMPVVLDVRVGFGPHSHLVPELLDMVLRDFPARKAAHQTSGRVTEGPPPRVLGQLSVRKLDMGAQL